MKAKNRSQKVDNLEEYFQAGFSDTLRDIPKAHSTIHEYVEETTGVRHIAVVKTIGRRTDRKYRVNSVKRIIDILDDLSSRGYVKAFLAPLAGMGADEDEYWVLSYPALTDEGMGYFEETYPDFNLKEDYALPKK